MSKVIFHVWLYYQDLPYACIAYSNRVSLVLGTKIQWPPCKLIIDVYTACDPTLYIYPGLEEVHAWCGQARHLPGHFLNQIRVNVIIRDLVTVSEQIASALNFIYSSAHNIIKDANCQLAKIS